jgi:integrase
MPRKRTSRLYSRTRGGQTRWYADFRDFADVGGSQEAMTARGERQATTDPDVAAELVAARLRELEAARRGRALIGVTREATLARFAAEHLKKKAKGIKAGAITEQWMESVELHLRTAVEFFGAGRDVAPITAENVHRYIAHLEEMPSGRGDATLSPGTQRKYLHSLSNLYRRAQAEGVVPPVYNPVSALMEKPSAAREEAAWLEVPAATMLLEAARTFRSKRDDMTNPAIYELLATFLLTGGRETEVYGLDLEDVSFDRKIVRFRPNRWRRLKTKTSHRTVPLWPQLEEILRPYVFGGRAPRSGLLFPSGRTGELITDIRKTLDRIGARVGYDAGEIRTKMFRHTYCAARLQTLDRGAPVSPWSVAKEMGHGGRTLVDQVYGHLGTIGNRSEVVEYRPEHLSQSHGEIPADFRAGE